MTEIQSYLNHFLKNLKFIVCEYLSKYCDFCYQPKFSFQKHVNLDIYERCLYITGLVLLYYFFSNVTLLLLENSLDFSITKFTTILFYALIFPLIGGLLLHIGTKSQGGKKKFGTSVTISLFSMTPLFLLAWVPQMGLVFGVIGYLILNIIGLNEMQNLSCFQALKAIFEPIILIIIATILIVLIINLFTMTFGFLKLFKII